MSNKFPLPETKTTPRKPTSSDLAGYMKKTKKRRGESTDAAALRYYAMLTNIMKGGDKPSAELRKQWGLHNQGEHKLRSIDTARRQLCDMKKTAWNDFVCREAKKVGNMPLSAELGGLVWYPTLEDVLSRNPNITVQEYLNLIETGADAKYPQDVQGWESIWNQTGDARRNRVPKVWQRYPDKIPTSKGDFLWKKLG